MTDKIASQGNMLYRIALRQKMDAVKNLSRLTETLCSKICSDGVKIITKGGNEDFLKADTIIIATGVKADKAYGMSFYGIATDTFLIGDCERPDKIMEAVFDGYTMACNI